MARRVQLSPMSAVFNRDGMDMRKQRGLSLVELLIAITLGLVLMAGVIQMFLSSRTVFSTQQALSRVQEGGRLAIEFISQDIRMAGYMGCVNRGTQLANDLGLDFWSKYTTPAPVAFPFSVEGLTAASAAALALTPAPVANSDVLAVRYAAGAPHILSQDNSFTPGVINVRAAGVVAAGNCVNGLCVGADVLVSNCTGASIFRIASISLNGDVSTINHVGGWPEANKAPSRYTIFNAGSELLPVWTVVYYVGVSPVSNRPALYRREGTGPSIELIDGVENISLRYRNGVVGDFFTAAEIVSPAQWGQIDAVSVEFLMQGNENNVLESPQEYIFAGATVPGPADRRVRQVFSTTVAIRSRVEDF